MLHNMLHIILQNTLLGSVVVTTIMLAQLYLRGHHDKFINRSLK
jgi:hypothetical protein